MIGELILIVLSIALFAVNVAPFIGFKTTAAIAVPSVLAGIGWRIFGVR